MEPLLVALAFVALALACGMSIVAWKLLRDRHDRSAARVEALQAMAFEADRETVHDDLEAPVARSHAPVAALEFDETPRPEPWDLPLGGGTARRAPAAREREPHSTAPALFDPAAAPAGAPSHRWMAVAAVALVLIAGVATTYALRTPEVTAAVAASRPSADPHPLELISLQHRIDATGGFQVTGLVQNPAAGPLLRDVVAVVYLFDERGNYFASGRAMLNMGQVAPGDEAPFVVSFPNAVGVSRYRVGFRYDRGGVVAHIDHRAPMSGTSAAPPDVGDAPAVTTAPRRSEG